MIRFELHSVKSYVFFSKFPHPFSGSPILLVLPTKIVSQLALAR